jgi:hypothetical protein
MFYRWELLLRRCAGAKRMALSAPILLHQWLIPFRLAAQNLRVIGRNLFGEGYLLLRIASHLAPGDTIREKMFKISLFFLAWSQVCHYFLTVVADYPPFEKH